MSLPQAMGGVGNPNTTLWTRGPITSRRINGKRWQAVIYYDPDRYVVIGVRNLSDDGAWTAHTYNGAGGLPELRLPAGFDANHYNPAIIIDSAGIIHFIWNGNRVPGNNIVLPYRKSTAAIDVWAGAVTANLQMTGVVGETQVNYPCLFADPLGEIYCTYRYGSAPDSDQYLVKYSTGTQSWSAVGATNGLIINGKVTPRGVYVGHVPVFSDDWDGAGTGRMWIVWVARQGVTVTDFNTDWRNLYAIYWDGVSWYNHAGVAQTMPATWANSTPWINAVPANEGWCPDVAAYDLATSTSGAEIMVDFTRRIVATELKDGAIALRSGGSTLLDVAIATRGRTYYDRVAGKFVSLSQPDGVTPGFRVRTQTTGLGFSGFVTIDDTEIIQRGFFDNALLRQTGRLIRLLISVASGSIVPVDPQIIDSGHFLAVPLSGVRTAGAAVSATVRSGGVTGYTTFRGAL